MSQHIAFSFERLSSLTGEAQNGISSHVLIDRAICALESEIKLLREFIENGDESMNTRGELETQLKSAKKKLLNILVGVMTFCHSLIRNVY